MYVTFSNNLKWYTGDPWDAKLTLTSKQIASDFRSSWTVLQFSLACFYSWGYLTPPAACRYCPRSSSQRCRPGEVYLCRVASGLQWRMRVWKYQLTQVKLPGSSKCSCVCVSGKWHWQEEGSGGGGALCEAALNFHTLLPHCDRPFSGRLFSVLCLSAVACNGTEAAYGVL